MALRTKIDFTSYKTTEHDRLWKLPAWGHPISLGVMPLFMRLNDRAIPIGTAFFTGDKVPFVLTAAHNIEAAAKTDPALERLVSYGPMQGEFSLKTGLDVLCSRVIDDRLQLTFLPLENVHGAPPTDIVIGFPMFDEGRHRLTNRVSFDFPKIGERVFSVGYRCEQYPEGGIPMDAVRNGSFDLHSEYQHDLYVAEGYVERIFVKEFMGGYLQGPCFAFDVEIKGGMSGGPIFNEAGNICGLNSATASSWFPSQMSLGSMLYMLLLSEVKYGAQIGPIKLSRKAHVFQLIQAGVLATDGSEKRLGFSHHAETNQIAIHGSSWIGDKTFIHDNFKGMQDGVSASGAEGELFKLVAPEKSDT